MHLALNNEKDFSADWIFTLKSQQGPSNQEQESEDQDTVRVKTTANARPSIVPGYQSQTRDLSPNGTIVNRNNDSVSKFDRFLSNLIVN